MELQYEERVCNIKDLCNGLMEFSDDEETLSFCDLLLCESEESESTRRISNPNSPDHQDFNFDLNSAGNISTGSESFAADDLIFNGSLLPLSRLSCNGSDSFTQKEKLQDWRSDSFRQKELLRNEKLQDWRSDSLESKSRYWSRSFNYSASHDKALRSVSSSAVRNKCNAKMANQTSFSSRSGSKTPSGWMKLCSLGINGTPVMKLEDLHLRQWKRNGNDRVGKPDLWRSVSSYYEEEPILNKKKASLHQRSESVKENKRAMETHQSKGFMTFPLFAPFNSCKSSINSVIDCVKTKKVH